MKAIPERAGQWWLPTKPDRKVPGILVWHPESGAKLMVSSLISDDLGDLPTVVFGELKNGQAVTLIDPFQRQVSGDEATIVAHQMLLGVRTTTPETLDVESVCVSMSGLKAWYGGTSIRPRPKDENRISIIEVHPAEGSVIGTYQQLKLEVWRGYSINHSIGETKIRDSYSLLVSAETPFQAAAAREAVEAFRRFLAVAMDQPIRLWKWEARVPEAIAGSKYVEFEWLTSQTKWTEEEPDHLFDGEYLFDWASVKEDAPRHFDLFNKVRKKASPSLDLYTGRLYGPTGYVVREFADLTQGLEGLHRVCRGGAYMEEPQFTSTVYPQLVDSIPNTLSNEHKQRLKGALRYGYEYSLRTRLKEILDRHEAIVTTVLDKPKSWVEPIVKLRNDLAHALEMPGGNKESLKRCFRLMQAVRFLFQIELLDLLGFRQDWISKRAETLRAAVFLKRR